MRPMLASSELEQVAKDVAMAGTCYCAVDVEQVYPPGTIPVRCAICRLVARINRIRSRVELYEKFVPSADKRA